MGGSRAAGNLEAELARLGRIPHRRRRDRLFRFDPRPRQSDVQLGPDPVRARETGSRTSTRSHRQIPRPKPDRRFDVLRPISLPISLSIICSLPCVNVPRDVAGLSIRCSNRSARITTRFQTVRSQAMSQRVAPDAPRVNHPREAGPSSKPFRRLQDVALRCNRHQQTRCRRRTSGWYGTCSTRGSKWMRASPILAD